MNSTSERILPDGSRSIFNLFSKEEFEKEVEAGYVRIRKHPIEDLWIANYSEKTQYEARWNVVTRHCRGLIFDSSHRIVARGYQKFFNLNQPEADDISMTEPVEVTDKKDGSLGVLFRSPVDGLFSVATRGSFISDQAVFATEWLRENSGIFDQSVEGFTPLVEIIYPENRIVCDYGDFRGLVLLGGVVIESGNYVGPVEAAELISWKGEITEVFEYSTLKEALEAPPRPGAEGLVVRAGNRIVKIKQEDYLKAHAYLTNCTPLQIWRKVREGYTLEDFLQEAPDEFIPLVTQYYTELVANMESIRGRVNSEWDLLQQSLPEGYSRKQLADVAKGNPHSPALFMLADGKDIEPYLLKKVKPSDLP